VLKLGLPAAAAGIALLIAGPGPAAPRRDAALVAHPRIFLTPGTLTSLRQRASAGSSEWQALKARCDLYLTGHVEWPDGDDYPDGGSIGEGYQGDGYFPPLLNLGLCYQTELGIDATQAAAYGAKGADILYRMSEPSGSHAINPLRDSGYGIRFYGLGMAIGYDWLYPALSTSLRTRVYTALNKWISAFESGGFERDFPQGNYFAGYYAAKGVAALATEGENPSASAQWSDWLNRLHETMVRPYYAANLSGGGWPEGWNYGPLGTLNMSWAVLAAQTAKGVDLLHDAAGPYTFPLESPRYSLYFTWPNLLTMEDSDAVYSGDNPTPTHPYFVTTEAGLLERWGSSFDRTFRSFARAIRAAQPGGELGVDWDLWQNFLFWNPSAPERSYTSLPLSYYAHGIERVAMRSSWAPDAVWAAFKAGPYVNYTNNGEEYFDKGSLAIVRGGRPLLVNAPAALLRNTPGTDDGSAFEGLVYSDNFDDGGQRDFYNIFYVDQPSRWGQGEYPRSGGAKTRIPYAEERGTYVATRGVRLEDQYPRDSSAAGTITSWTRDVVYLRPEIFVVYDRTTVTSAAIAQWTAFHFPKALVAATAPAPGVARYDVGSGSAYAGTIESVFPAGHVQRIIDLFGGHKVYRLEVRPGAAATSNRWLAVLDAAQTPASAALASRLSAGGGTVLAGQVLGTVLRTPSSSYAVVVPSGAGPATGEVKYVIPAAATRHVLVGLAPNTAYAVSASVAGGKATIDLVPGSGLVTSRNGVLSVQTCSSVGVSS
jgi:hypothetical protein